MTLSLFLSQDWLSGTSPCPSIPAAVDQEVLKLSLNHLKQALHREFSGPLEHRETYSQSWASGFLSLQSLLFFSFIDKYEFLVSGEAKKQVEEFISKEHVLAEFKSVSILIICMKN